MSSWLKVLSDLDHYYKSVHKNGIKFRATLSYSYLQDDYFLDVQMDKHSTLWAIIPKDNVKSTANKILKNAGYK